MDYLAKSKEIISKIKSYQDSTDGWKEVKATKDVTVWSKPSPEWNGTLYKAEGVIHAEPETVFKYVEPIPDGPRASWDKAIKSLEMLERADEKLAVVRTVTHSAFAGVVASRDFIDLAVTVREEGCVSTNASTVTHPEWPAMNDPVRGVNHPCSIACYSLAQSTKSTKVISFFQSDLGGRLPQNIVDMALPTNIVNFYSNLRKSLEENGLMHMNGTT